MRRVAATAIGALALVAILASPAMAHDCNVFINPGDCENTAWTVGVIATIAAATAAVTGLTRNGKPSCAELRAQAAKAERERERLRGEHRKCQAVLAQIATGIARAEEDHRALVAELEKTLPYFIGAGALAGATLATLAGSLFGAIGRGFTAMAQRVGSVNVTAGLSTETAGGFSIRTLLSGEVAATTPISPAQAALNTQQAMIADHLAQASYWIGLMPDPVKTGVAGGAAGGLSGGAVQSLMNRALADHQAALQRHYDLQRRIEEACREKSDALDDADRATDDLAEKLKDCA